ncbi:hypothetical protein ABPG74_017712 [Tetrahymena malaccensis]
MQQQSILNNNMQNSFQYNQNLLANRAMKIVQPFAQQYFQMQQQPRISQFQHDMCEIDKKIVKCAFKKKRMLKRLLTWIALLNQEKELEKQKLDFQIYCQTYTKNSNMQDTKNSQKVNSNCIESEEKSQTLQKKPSQEIKQSSQTFSDVNKSSSLNTPQKITVTPTQDACNKLPDQKTQQLKKEVMQSNDTSFEETPKFNQKKVQSPLDLQENSTQIEKRDHQKLSDTIRKQPSSLNDSQVFDKKRSVKQVSEFNYDECQADWENSREIKKKMKKSEKYKQKLLQKQQQKHSQQTEKNSQKSLKSQKEKFKAHKHSQQEQQYNLYKSQNYKQVKVEETNFDEDFERNSDFEFEENNKDLNKKQHKVDINQNLIEDTNNFQKKQQDKTFAEDNQKADKNESQNQQQNQQENCQQSKDLNNQTPVKPICENKSSRESSLNKQQSREKQWSTLSTETKTQSQNNHLLTSPNESAIESTQPSQNEQFQSSLMSQSNDQTQLISNFSNTKIEQLEEQLIEFISEGQRDLDSVLEKAFHLREQFGLTKKDLTLSEKWYKQFLLKYQIEFEE